MTNERSTGTSSKLATLLKMMGLVKPLSGFMALAVVSGTLAYLAVQFIPVLGGYAILDGLGLDVPIPSATIWIILPLLALLRAVLRFTEQRLNHFIAFKLLALVRDRVFGALRRLCPARLEGRDKGELVSLITADVELLEVFYAHTISPICIALIVETVMCIYIGTFHIGLGLLALAAFLCVGIVVPVIISGVSGNSRLDNLINGYGILAYEDGTTPLAIIKSLFMVPDIIAKPTLFSGEQVRNGSLAAYLPCFSIAGVIAYCRIFRASWKKKMVLLCGVFAFVPVLNSAFSAFNAGYYARWFYMPILVMSAMTARALETGRNSELSSGAKITAAATAAIMLCAFLPVLEKGKVKWFAVSSNRDLLKTEMIATAVQLAALLFLLVLMPGMKKLSKYRKSALIIVTAASCLLTSMAVLYNGNSLIAKTGGQKWKRQMLESKPALRDTSSFFRVETDGTSTNYEMVWGYPTIHCFESTVNPSIFTFYRKIGMIRTVESTLPIERVGARSLLSVRYYIENDLVKPSETLEEKGGMTGYEEGLPNNGYRIYENTNYIPMGFTFDSYISDEDYSSMKKGEQSDRLLVKDIILTEEQISRYGRFLQEDLHAEEKTISEDTANLERDNLVFFSVPYDEGFTAAVDGASAVIEKVDGGLMAVFVPSGSHRIEFTYYPKGLRTCIVISAAASVLAASAFLINILALRKKE